MKTKLYYRGMTGSIEKASDDLFYGKLEMLDMSVEYRAKSAEGLISIFEDTVNMVIEEGCAGKHVEITGCGL